MNFPCATENSTISIITSKQDLKTRILLHNFTFVVIESYPLLPERSWRSLNFKLTLGGLCQMGV